MTHICEVHFTCALYDPLWNAQYRTVCLNEKLRHNMYVIGFATSFLYLYKCVKNVTHIISATSAQCMVTQHIDVGLP